MKTISEFIIVNVPVSAAYNQWTQFEEFPEFMEGVKEVRQMGDKMLHWKAEIGGKIEEWDAEIHQQVPDRIIAWRSIGGAKNSGQVVFTAEENDQTKVFLEIQFDPEGIIETLGAAAGVVEARVAADLKRFKQFIEAKGQPTGAWRGEIKYGEVRS